MSRATAGPRSTPVLNNNGLTGDRYTPDGREVKKSSLAQDNPQ
jgi:hypothetical protein